MPHLHLELFADMRLSVEPVQITNGDVARVQLVRFTHHYFVTLGHDTENIKGSAASAAQTFALPDGVARIATVFADDITMCCDQVARCECVMLGADSLTEKLCVIAGWHEADFLRLRL